MSYYINQNNPADNESSNNVPTGEAHNDEEELIEKIFKKGKQKDTPLSKEKIKLALDEIQKTILEIMEEKGVDEVPIVLNNGQTVYFSKPDTPPAQPPNDQPQ